MTDWTIRGLRSDGTRSVGHWGADGTDPELTIRSRFDDGWTEAVLIRDGVEVAWITSTSLADRKWWVSPDA